MVSVLNGFMEAQELTSPSALAAQAATMSFSRETFASPVSFKLYEIMFYHGGIKHSCASKLTN